jgi:hypothetical protein
MNAGAIDQVRADIRWPGPSRQHSSGHCCGVKVGHALPRRRDVCHLDRACDVLTSVVLSLLSVRCLSSSGLVFKPAVTGDYCCRNLECPCRLPGFGQRHCIAFYALWHHRQTHFKTALSIRPCVCGNSRTDFRGVRH